MATFDGGQAESVTIYPHGMVAIREVWSKATKRDRWTVERWWTVHARPGAFLVHTHEAQPDAMFEFPDDAASGTFEETWMGIRVMTHHPPPMEWRGHPPWIGLDPLNA